MYAMPVNTNTEYCAYPLIRDYIFRKNSLACKEGHLKEQNSFLAIKKPTFYIVRFCSDGLSISDNLSFLRSAFFDFWF